MKLQRGAMTPRAIFGLTLIVLAVLLFLNNIGFRLLGVVISHWPLVALGVGIYLLVKHHRSAEQGKSPGALPFVLLALGGVGLLTRYGIFSISMGAIVGPLVLLLVGLHLFRPHKSKLRFCYSEKKDKKKSPPAEQSPTEVIHLPSHAPNFTEQAESREQTQTEAEPKTQSQYKDEAQIDVMTFLGGSNYCTRSQKLKHGNVVCFLGGVEIDVTEADTEEEVIEVDVLAFMGGVEMKIPAHWQVTIKAIPFLGGVSNRTTCLADKMGVPKKHLIITGLACMGGLEIRN